MARHGEARGVGKGLLRPTPRPKGVLAQDDMIAALVELDANGLCLQWRNHLGGTPPAHLARWLLMRILAYRIQATAHGGLDKETLRVLRQPKGKRLASTNLHPFEARIATTREGTKLQAGALLAREWKGRLERVMILEKGFAWNRETYGSLSQVAKAMTGTSWNGHRFFGLRTARSDRSAMPSRRRGVCDVPSLDVAAVEAPQQCKVGRGTGSLDVTGAANGEMALIRTAGRREGGKAASP
jgi:Protein of unknown function (DUF2924)